VSAKVPKVVWIRLRKFDGFHDEYVVATERPISFSTGRPLLAYKRYTLTPAKPKAKKRKAKR